jgi:uncharacterized protein (TIGR03085 family)
MTYTGDERLAMCDTFADVGPDHPTLAGSWTTRDLIAHLIVRERRPDASLGILLRPLAGLTEKARQQVLTKPYEQLVESFRKGPPIWTWSAIPLVGDRANLFEFYVHHEDIRRADDHWQPRPHDDRREQALWSGLTTMGKLMFRKSPVGVVMSPAERDEITVRKGDRLVHLVGEPSEIALVAFGRATDRTRVVIQGDPADIAAFEASPRGI